MEKIINETAIPKEFENMYTLAKAYFNSANCGEYEYHQCLVLQTNDGDKIFSFCCDEVEDLVNQNVAVLDRGKITAVQKILCMWEGGTVDVPSGKFMKKLCGINSENKKAQVLLKTINGAFAVKTIENIIGRFL